MVDERAELVFASVIVATSIRPECPINLAISSEAGYLYGCVMSARTLMVLFTDLVGSTSAWAGLDRAAADRRRARHFGLMRSDLGQHGGREVKNLGDGLRQRVAAPGRRALRAAGTEFL